MSRERLEDSLEHLRRELDSLPPGATSDRLRALIDDIERQLDGLEKDEGDVGTLLAGIRRHLEAFEIEHPRITGILNDLMVTLANMGI